jgi:hypothetical protein
VRRGGIVEEKKLKENEGVLRESSSFDQRRVERKKSGGCFEANEAGGGIALEETR